MAIIYNQENGTFTLQTQETTYQMQVDQYGYLLHLYYGKSVKGCMDYLLSYADRGFSGNPYEAGMDRTYSMDALPQEFPCSGTGDFRNTALLVQNPDGSFAADMRFKEYKIYNGKYRLAGLPAVYASADEAQTLEITLEDTANGLRAILMYGVLEAGDIITRSVKLVNQTDDTMYLNRLHPACLDMINGSYDIISFYGRHAMERNYQRLPVAHGSYVIGSKRGTSSHQYSPMIFLTDEKTTEEYGSCYAMSFVYSGGFQVEAERDQYHQTRVLMGLWQEGFRYPLKKGVEFCSPEVILSYTHQGLNRLSQNLHQCIRTHICRGKYKDQVRPVLLNSWEASYFDFTGESIYQLAKKAAEAGIEMLVLDDGWFGKRDDDNSGLGDWFVNEEKLGGTLSNLVMRINALGLKFGIWAEPEMVSEDSELYRKHPDYALRIPGRKPIRARNQLVLDFSRKEVVDHVYDQICSVLDQANIEYLKWDMNRSISDVYSAAGTEQGSVLYDYVLGLYDFLERLNVRYPNLLIEGCSGGGGRFDVGMLYYTPQIWCSDNTDPIERVLIQYGTSFGFPASTVGAHVSASPNHQTGRSTSMQTRAAAAMAGTFGFELDLCSLTEEDLKEIKNQIETYKAFAPLIQEGTYYRLSNPYKEEIGAWEFVSDNQEEVLVQGIHLDIHANMPSQYLKLKGLKQNAVYQEASSGLSYDGAALQEAGFLLPARQEEYEAFQLHFKAV